MGKEKRRVEDPRALKSVRLPVALWRQAKLAAVRGDETLREWMADAVARKLGKKGATT